MDAFDAAAREFQLLAPTLWDPVSAPLVTRSDPQAGERVLDACCGTGSSALPTALAVGPTGGVDAVDLSRALSDLLRTDPRRPAWLSVHTADVTTWRREDYDVVQCSLGVFFFPDMAAGTEHLVSRLRPGVAPQYRYGDAERWWTSGRHCRPPAPACSGMRCRRPSHRSRASINATL